MKFTFVITTTAEVDEKDYKLDVKKLEEYINEKLFSQSFGTSVEKYHYGFELFSFNGKFVGWFQKNHNLVRYSWKNKYLLSVGQIDWNKYKIANKKNQFKMISQSILESIKNLQLLKKKPKDFHFPEFETCIANILREFEIGLGNK